ncbi:hypothetical protein [Azospirillum doebereinerae]
MMPRRRRRIPSRRSRHESETVQRGSAVWIDEKRLAFLVTEMPDL